MVLELFDSICKIYGEIYSIEVDDTNRILLFIFVPFADTVFLLKVVTINC